MLEEIYNQNIWWQTRDQIRQDPHIKQFNKQPVKWQPSILDTIKFDQFRIYTIRGPRQVGKTTGLKMLIQKLLADKKIAPQQIMYYSLEDIDDFHHLIKLIDIYLQELDNLDLGQKFKFIFLDEITLIKNWERAIKLLIDRGKIGKTVMVLTGSSSFDLKHSIERLPGRRGRGMELDRNFYPLSFREYVSLFFKGQILQITQPLFLADNFQSILKKLKEIAPYHTKIKKLFSQYLLTGGFIKAINELSQYREINTDIYNIYNQWLIGDIVKLGRSRSTYEEVVSCLVDYIGAVFGYENIAKKTSIATHKTVAEYLDILEDSFIIKLIYQADLNTGRPKFKKYKKTAFLDPFIYWTLLGNSKKWSLYYQKAKHSLRDQSFKAKLIETVIGGHLIRGQGEDWVLPNVLFWRNNSEIDFLISLEQNKLFPIEVKYQNKVDQRDFKTIFNQGFNQGVIFSKQDLALVNKNFLIVPVELGLLLV